MFAHVSTRAVKSLSTSVRLHARLTAACHKICTMSACWHVYLRHTAIGARQGEAVAQATAATEAQLPAAATEAQLPAADPTRPRRRTRGLWGAMGGRPPGGPEALRVPPAVPPTGALPDAGDSVADVGAAGTSGSSVEADTPSSTASSSEPAGEAAAAPGMSMPDLTRLLHVRPLRASPCVACCCVSAPSIHEHAV